VSGLVIERKRGITLFFLHGGEREGWGCSTHLAALAEKNSRGRGGKGGRVSMIAKRKKKKKSRLWRAERK